MNEPFDFDALIGYLDDDDDEGGEETLAFLRLVFLGTFGSSVLGESAKIADGGRIPMVC